jgi:hypothetical protein
MGTMARGLAGLLVMTALFAPVRASAAGASVERGAAQNRGRTAVITGGHDKNGSWLSAEYRELQVRKRTDRASLAVTIELRAGADLVTFSVSPRSVSVSRGGRQITLDSVEALAAMQELLGGSAAVFGVRAMLSELESASGFTAPDMALLPAAAFVASLVGDVSAPQRIADRFVEKHRGIFRQIRWEGSCWSKYTAESTAAWDELQGCMGDADDKGFFRAAYERIACNTIWLLRSESAWFEYLNCLTPLGPISQ